MNSLLLRWTIVLVFISYMPFKLNGQDGPGDSGRSAAELRLTVRGGGALYWATEPSVQCELRIDGLTRKKLAKQLESFVAEMVALQPEKNKFAAASPKEQKALPLRLVLERELRLEVTAAEDLYAVLSVDQINRLNGTYLQHFGTDALLRNEVRAWLKISYDQFKELAAIRTACGIAMTAEMKQSETEESRRRITALKEDRDRKALEILTDEQRVQLGNAKGPPFVFKLEPSQAGSDRK